MKVKSFKKSQPEVILFKSAPTDDHGNTPAQRRKLIAAGKCPKHRKKGCKKC